MNEVSNGISGSGSGTQEYVEFVVVSDTITYSCTSPTPPCIDIRGWIFDDNSGYHGPSGIASGAVRFSFNALWSCVPVGTIIVIYNDLDRNPAVPADDISLSDGNCRIIAPISSTALFEKNTTTPGAAACSYPALGWTPGGLWANTALANTSDCARIVNLAGCEVFSVCYGAADNLNTLIYFAPTGTSTVYYFNGIDPTLQANWSSGLSASFQTPGVANNAANAAYINQFNNGCAPITPINVTATSVNAGCSCTGTATATATGSIPGYTYTWCDASFVPIGQTTATATGLCGGVYNVVATSSIGCMDTATVTITSSPTTTVTVNSQSICAGTSTTLTATPSLVGGTYSWSPGGLTTSTISISPSSTTTYTVTYTLSGCTSTGVGTVTVTPLPVTTVNSPTICAGATATLTATGATTYLWSTGVTTNSISVTPLSTTSYTVTGTTSGCTSTAVAAVTVNPLPVVTVNSPTICAGDTATLSASGATTYVWSSGTSINPFSVVPATTTSYTVTGTSLGCTASAVSTVAVNPLPLITVNSPIICSGAATTLTATGATTYLWNSGSTTNPLTVSPATTTFYVVTGTLLGCTSSAIATVIVNPLPSPTVNSPTICNGDIATLTATGGTSYTWSTGAITNPINVSPIATTSYTVTASSSGCTNTAVAIVTVNPLPVITVNSPTICNGSVASLVAGGAVSYSWSAGAVSTGVTTANASPVVTSTYTVTGTSLGCTSTAVSTVTVNPTPLVTVNSPSICPASTASLVASGATTYVWSAGATSTGISTADASPATTTSYTVTGTSLGCTATAISIVTVNSVLTVNAGVDDTICFGGSTVLNVIPNGAGYTYNWTPTASLTGASTFNPTVNPTSTTTYSVTVTNASGCSGTSTVTVYADSQITLAASGIDVTCNGACNGQATVVPSGGAAAYSYLWSSGCTSPSCNSLCPGSYSVTVIDAWGCTSSSVVTIVEPTVLTGSITSNSPASCNAICDGAVTALGAGGTVGPGYSYSWNTIPVQNTAAAAGLCAGSYTCTITDANACAATITANVTEPSIVVIAPVASVIACPGASTILNASATGGNGGPYNYVWSPSGTGTTASVTVNPVSTTTYTINATDSNGCAANPESVTVTVTPPLLVAAAGNLSICPGASTNILATATQGNGGPYTYTWAPVGTPAGSLVSVSPTVTTTYTVTAADGCSSTATATVTITMLPIPVIAFSADTTSGCAPMCVSFTNNSTIVGGTISNWFWNFGDGQSDTPSAVTHCYQDAGSYSVSLTATTNNGCVSTFTQNSYITVFPIPIAEFSSSPVSADIFNPIINFNNQSTNASFYVWNFGDFTTSNQTDPAHTYCDEGQFSVMLIATNEHGCVDSVMHLIEINGIFTFYAPNAFTPNNDIHNNIFLPVGEGWNPDKFDLMIFDRWGNLCFETKDMNMGWDGKANKGSEIAQEDVYVWKVILTDVFDKNHRYVGSVTIVK